MFRALLTASLLTAGTASAVSVPDHFSSFWVLGDSLSDPGNVFAATGGLVPTSPPYFEGRFSNGPIWAEFLTDAFAADGKPTGNFAFGGAKAIADADLVPDLELQALTLTAERGSFGARPLVSIWMGGNDVRGAADPLASAIAAAQKIGDVADALALLGIRDFLIFDVPALILPGGDAFNAALADEIAEIRSANTVYEVNTQAVLAAIALDPSSEITNFTDPCLETVSLVVLSVCSPQEAKARLRFDDIHPNAEAHEHLARAAAASIAVVPLPAGAPLLLMGVAALAIGVRRSRG